jgi:hypothetical protein
MSSWTPRGLAGVVAGGTGAAGLMNPTVLAGLPAASPRLVGEIAYGLGSASRGVSNAGNAASSKLAQLLGISGGAPLTMNKLAPLLATTPVLAANQR